MVIDRHTAARIAADVEGLGGAWRDLFRAWQRSDTDYLIFLAHTAERIAKRAPLTAMTNGTDGLRAALRLMCGQLSDVECRWFLFVERNSEAERITREELLLDAEVGGIA